MLKLLFQVFPLFSIPILPQVRFSETDAEWYLQVERLPCWPLSLSFNDSHYFISLEEMEREGNGYKKKCVTKLIMIKRKKDHWWRKGQIWQIDMRIKSLIQGRYPVLHCWNACDPGQSVTYRDKTALYTLIRAIFLL